MNLDCSGLPDIIFILFVVLAWREPTRDEDGIANSLAIGLSTGLLFLAVIVAFGIFLLRTKG